MNKKKNIFKVGIGYTIGNVMLKGVVFITTPIFARLMTKADYGKYNVFASYESLFFVIIGLAIHSSYKNAYYKYRSDDNSEGEIQYQKYLSITMCFLFTSLVVWLLIAFAFNEMISNILGIDGSLLFVLVVGSMVTAIANCYTTDEGIHYRYKSILVISLVNTLSSVCLSLLLIRFFFANYSYVGRIIGGLIPGLIIYGFIAIKYLFRSSPKGMKRALSWGIKYSFPIVPHGVSQVVLTQFDRIMILKMIGESQAGVYSFAYTIYSMLTVISSSIDGIWAPWFYEKRKAEDDDAIKKGSALCILLIFFASAFVILLCPELIGILGGSKYYQSIYCAVPIVGGGFFACIYNIPCLVEYYHEKTKLIALSTGLAAILNIGLNAVFIPRYGYVAAAYTTLVTYIIYFIVHYYMAYRIEGRNLFLSHNIIVCVFGLFLSMAGSLLFVSSIVIRISFLIILLLSAFIYEEMKFSFIRKRMKKY